MDEITDATRRLVDYAANARSVDLPDEVRERTRLHILDTLAAIISGSALPAGLAGQRYAATVQGTSPVSILGTRSVSDPVSAAIANGMAGHADESDDSQESGQIHPGCGILPAALAAGELTPASGSELERAIALGYDVAARFGEMLQDSFNTFRSSPATHGWGPVFGGGFAAGSIGRLTPDQLVTLLSYLTQEASGITTWTLDLQHVLKSYLFGGMPAGAALRALRFVQLGFSGTGDVFVPTRRNLLDALGIATDRARHLSDSLGERWIMLETELKTHPVGFPVILPVSLVEGLIREHSLRAEDVIELRLYYHDDWYGVIGTSPMPDVNVRYCMGVALRDGRLGFAAIHADDLRLDDPTVAPVMDRMRLLPLPEGMDRMDGRIEIDTAAGTLVAEQRGSVLGRLGNPMPRPMVEDKALELMEPVLGRQRTVELIAATRDLHGVADIRDLIALTRPEE